MPSKIKQTGTSQNGIIKVEIRSQALFYEDFSQTPGGCNTPLCLFWAPGSLTFPFTKRVRTRANRISLFLFLFILDIIWSNIICFCAFESSGQRHAPPQSFSCHELIIMANASGMTPFGRTFSLGMLSCSHLWDQISQNHMFIFGSSRKANDYIYILSSMKEIYNQNWHE